MTTTIGTPDAGLNMLEIKAAELPVLPITAQKVLALMCDPDVSIEKLKRLIVGDPGLATKILMIANSAFYGGNRNIQNLNQAILRLGLNSVRSIVVATSMKNAYKSFGLTEKLLWEQLIGSAMAASTIAKQTRYTDAEDAFIGGLLHDVGKVVLNNEYPEVFSRIMERVYNDSLSFDVVEREEFGFSQRKIGASVVKKWGFPESLELLLLNYDNNEYLGSNQDFNNLVSVIRLADKMCQKIGMGWRKPGGDEVSYDGLPEEMGLNKEALDSLYDNVKIVLEDSASLY